MLRIGNANLLYQAQIVLFTSFGIHRWTLFQE